MWEFQVDYLEFYKHFHLLLRAALAGQLWSEALDALCALAVLYVDGERYEMAANVLAVIRNHPYTPDDIRNQAEDLWLELESRICPRVLADAQQYAVEHSLEQVIAEVLAIVD